MCICVKAREWIMESERARARWDRCLFGRGHSLRSHTWRWSFTRSNSFPIDGLGKSPLKEPPVRHKPTQMGGHTDDHDNNNCINN